MNQIPGTIKVENRARGEVRLPFASASEREAAAQFINSLISSGTALFTSRVENNEMLIQFTGGY